MDVRILAIALVLTLGVQSRTSMCVRVQHQPTTWTSFFFDLHILVAVFPAGVWLCARELNDERVFIILYAISAAYFSGVMVLYSHPNPYYILFCFSVHHLNVKLYRATV